MTGARTWRVRIEGHGLLLGHQDGLAFHRRTVAVFVRARAASSAKEAALEEVRTADDGPVARCRIPVGAPPDLGATGVQPIYVAADFDLSAREVHLHPEDPTAVAVEDEEPQVSDGGLRLRRGVRLTDTSDLREGFERCAPDEHGERIVADDRPASASTTRPSTPRVCRGTRLTTARCSTGRTSPANAPTGRDSCTTTDRDRTWSDRGDASG